MQQGNVGSVKKKDVEGELGWISAGLCGLKECKGKDSRQPSYPCEFLLRAQNAEKSTYFYFSPSEVLWKSGITINMFCGDFLKFIPLKSLPVSHEIPPFLFFSFLFGNFSLFPFILPQPW